jgi:hypothetical protein
VLFAKARFFAGLAFVAAGRNSCGRLFALAGQGQIDTLRSNEAFFF